MTAPPAIRARRRSMAVRHEIAGTLETVTALRVGGWTASVTADLVVARDGLDRFVLPGTSLAGALRSWLGGVTGQGTVPLFTPADLARLFGDLSPGTDTGELCLIRVDDAVAIGDVRAGVRDGVGIDRGTGTAAAGLLYQHEVIPPGSQFALRLTATEPPGDPQRVGQALDLLVGALAGSRIELGAARTRGLGLVTMTGVSRTRIDLADPACVLDWLCGRLTPGSQPGPPGGQDPVADGKLAIEIAWSQGSPVMVRASTASAPDPEADRDVDTVPLYVTGPDGSARLLLPGSSIKGVLRSHAERIMRTLLRYDDVPASWLDQVNDDRLDPVGALFGTARPKNAGSSGQPGRRGAVTVRDCCTTSAGERVVTHVAIDRWTGGSAENLLFSVREPATADWEPIQLSLDTSRLRGTEPERALALLLLVLRDLADGWLAAGFGGTAGRGALTVSGVRFTGSGLPQPWASLAGRTLRDLTGEPPPAVTRAFVAWKERAGQ